MNVSIMPPMSSKLTVHFIADKQLWGYIHIMYKEEMVVFVSIQPPNGYKDRRAAVRLPLSVNNNYINAHTYTTL